MIDIWFILNKNIIAMFNLINFLSNANKYNISNLNNIVIEINIKLSSINSAEIINTFCDSWERHRKVFRWKKKRDLFDWDFI